MKYFYALILCLTFSSYASMATTIHGQISPNTIITIYQYTDYIVYNTQELTEITTDNDGTFSTDITIGKLNRLRLNIGSEVVNFYASNDINYTLSEKNNKYTITTDNDKENINDKLKYALADWNTVHNIWVKDRRFVAIDMPEKILHKLDTIKANIISDRYRDAYEYNLANKAMFYIVHSYVKSDSVVAHQQFDKLIEDMIINKPVAISNPFYTSFLRDYVRHRMNATKFLRVRQKEPVYNRVIREANSFANDSLRELIQVIGMEHIYGHTWYDSISVVNAKATQLRDKMTIQVFKDYMDLVINCHNKVGIGDVFPIVPLQDDKGNIYSIDKINTSYILVDFWATWCSPCKRGMTKFAELKAKYKDRLEIVSISADAEWQDMIDYLDSKNYTDKWIALFNGNKGGYHDVVPISSYPTYYILNSNKKVIAIPKSNELINTIDKLMK